MGRVTKKDTEEEREKRRLKDRKTYEEAKNLSDECREELKLKILSLLEHPLTTEDIIKIFGLLWDEITGRYHSIPRCFCFYQTSRLGYAEKATFATAIDTLFGEKVRDAFCGPMFYTEHNILPNTQELDDEEAEELRQNEKVRKKIIDTAERGLTNATLITLLEDLITYLQEDVEVDGFEKAYDHYTQTFFEIFYDLVACKFGTEKEIKKVEKKLLKKEEEKKLFKELKTREETTVEKPKRKRRKR
eukprot:TRINITY_DN766_c0_g2_i1.p1 TRINITY_DN766_c0_g2~~TRINITY_DN766_c0_g2_i1.p1  ORF type:complete len:276 (+),score=44.20 TRINITY_DN766_c0_g2_i1:92-829(+)